MPPITQFYQFSLSVDAIKNVPIVGPSGDGTKYLVNWFFDESNQGASGEVKPDKDEALFDMKAQFISEQQGLLTGLLQLNVLAIKTTGERELAGVLMIDLNAHVPKLPSKNSRQRATLHMSRCPGPKPLLIRLTILCSPVTASQVPKRSVTGSVPPVAPPTAAPVQPRQQQQQQESSVERVVQRGPGKNSVVSASTSPLDLGADSPAPTAPPGQRANSNAQHQQQGLPAAEKAALQDQLNRLRATVATLSSANEQLRDENVMLRAAVERSRKEPDYTFTAGGGGRPSVSPIPRATSAASATGDFEYDERNAELLTEIKTQQAELAILQKGLASARDTIRQLSSREEGFQREIAQLVRTNKALEDEMLALKDQQSNVDLRYETALGIARTSGGTGKAESELLAAREMLTATQQMNRDLKAMLDAATNSQTELKADVKAAKHEVSEAQQKYHQMVQQYQQREQEATMRADKAEHGSRLVEKQSKQLHDYCGMAQDRAKQLLHALEAERGVSEKRRKKILDLKALLNAHHLAGSIEL